MALPPETHSATLTAGPGPGPLLASAEEWQRLSLAYSDTAAELTQLLAEVQTSQWQGTGAEAYMAAHLPYLAWLNRASADSAINAAQHQNVAAAYSGALATMPTLEELAANHAIHAVLVATNFFGVNTVPIALNEADYFRMWVQAAETMTLYEAVSAAAVATAPQVPPAPAIVSNPAEAGPAEDGGAGNWLQELVRLITELLENAGNVEELLRIFEEFFKSLGFNPVIAGFLAGVALVLYDMLWYPYYASYALLLLPFFAPMLSALSALKLLPMLLAYLFPPLSAPNIGTGSPTHPNTDIPSAVVVAPPAAAGSSAGAGVTASPPGATSPVVTPTVDGVAALIPYLVSGWAPPGVEAGPRSDMAASSSAAAPRRATSQRPVSADARSQRGRRRRGRIRMHGDRYEYLRATDDAGIGAASDTGNASPTNTTSEPRTSAIAAGLSRSSPLGRASMAPLLPATWSTADQGERMTLSNDDQDHK
ncbi:hypothetical protein BST33_11130 [Mycolicibacter minnesotensis]|uniref:PPE domain-containing protein n=2 Tax=Mycolicibacter minnesotensis TaxID=1118379 RepID=A0AA91M5T0_9MYCO|nr:hypothetical protein BST33_11130 [Mycolicibacter minnesotensis]